MQIIFGSWELVLKAFSVWFVPCSLVKKEVNDKLPSYQTNKLKGECICLALFIIYAGLNIRIL